MEKQRFLDSSYNDVPVSQIALEHAIDSLAETTPQTEETEADFKRDLVPKVAIIREAMRHSDDEKSFAIKNEWTQNN